MIVFRLIRCSNLEIFECNCDLPRCLVGRKTWSSWAYVSFDGVDRYSGRCEVLLSGQDDNQEAAAMVSCGVSGTMRNVFSVPDGLKRISCCYSRGVGC
jgi:hypothetical protein